MTARTPDPPYWAVIFTSLRHEEGPHGARDDSEDLAYHEMATRMVELAREQPGFLGVESARGDDGLGITVSYWESEEAIRAWKQHTEHRVAQRRGLEEWYSAFELRVARVERSRSFVADNEASDEADGRVLWFERRFDLGRPADELRELQQRLATGPARLAVALRGVDEAVLRAKPAGAWSILENLGHLGDLEALWAGRVDDLLNEEDELRPADLENLASHRAGHNGAELQTLIDRFTMQRIEWLTRLGEFQGKLAQRTALHPRLQEPMSIVDLCFFVAEHDDHHLVTVQRLVERTS